MLNSKRVLSAAIASLVIANSASAAGVYVGGQLGYGTNHQDGFSNAYASSIFGNNYSNTNKNDGLAGRVFAGYDLTENFAAELGYTRFSDSVAKMSNNFATVKATIRTYAVDLSGKATLPLTNGFSVFGKLGAAYLNEEASGSITGYNYSATKTQPSVDKILPTFGAGVGYEVTKNLIADVSWSRIQKVDNSSGLQSTDFVGAGLSYHFG